MNLQDLHRLGKKAADQMGEGPGEDRVAAQREAVSALLEADDRRTSTSRSARPGRFARPVWVALPALAGAALSVLIFALAWLLWPASEDRRAAPEEGLVLTARATPLVMELDGGNAARLSPDSVGQLAVSTPKEVRVVLIHGELTSTIRTPVRWSVQAGPYTVEAAGTEYVVRWKDERLEVRVQRGRVRVLGREAPQAGWLVEAGERLTIDGGRLLEKTGTAPAAPGSDPDGTPPIAVDAPPPPASGSGDVLPTPPPVPVEIPATTEPPRPGMESAAMEAPPAPPAGARIPPPAEPAAPPPWRSHLQREEYAQAVAWIEKQGVSAFADQASLADLQAMANAARYAGRGQSALVLLVSLRTRFPGTGQASTAAFLMGRVYSEQLKDHRAAVSWFSTYLAEVPAGSLVEEALGRKMDAAQRAGMTAEAKRTAALLLERHPASPFRPLAQQILSVPPKP